LVSENKPLRDCIVRFLARGSPRKAAEIAAFYADGAPVSRRLDWAQSDALERLGIEADFLAAGLRPEGIGPVRGAMIAALGQLTRSGPSYGPRLSREGPDHNGHKPRQSSLIRTNPARRSHPDGHWLHRSQRAKVTVDELLTLQAPCARGLRKD